MILTTIIRMNKIKCLNLTFQSQRLEEAQCAKKELVQMMFEE